VGRWAKGKNGWMGIWVNGWMDGWMDRQTGRQNVSGQTPSPAPSTGPTEGRGPDCSASHISTALSLHLARHASRGLTSLGTALVKGKSQGPPTPAPGKQVLPPWGTQQKEVGGGSVVKCYISH
jgi:hypothetical protein